MATTPTHESASEYHLRTEAERNRYRVALERLDAIKTDDPRMGFQDYYDAVTDIVREALED